ncbi:hypothetical protein GDO78_014071 [Eleutherodactylus coqui]|uniref:Ig-like domain-containing protein n=1 Tax=Eleutherodactylus coqui TaxID=57060 RepID=A0A8J6B1P9_ELECQ|nr:hypothetical protein GDO78_014071 [Eleutherodactylus coqui]
MPQYVQSDTQVSQDPDLHVIEDQDITLKCSHTIKNYRLLIWYKHIPGLGPEICAHGLDSAVNAHPRYSMTMNKSSFTTQLHIKNVRGEDAAVYYCAVEDTVTLTH